MSNIRIVPQEEVLRRVAEERRAYDELRERLRPFLEDVRKLPGQPGRLGMDALLNRFDAARDAFEVLGYCAIAGAGVDDGLAGELVQFIHTFARGMVRCADDFASEARTRQTKAWMRDAEKKQ